MPSDDVLLTKHDAVAAVTLNRPDRLNAMTTASFTMLVDVLEDIAADDTVRAVVLTGAGRGFCAGGDLNAMADSDLRPEPQAVQELRSLMRASELLRQMPKVTIAAVNGPCAGAGFSIACAADVRLAAESAVFKTAFLDAGLSGDFGGSWTLPRLIGEAAARALYLLSPRVSAAEAYRLRLVFAVVPDEDLQQRAVDMARQAAEAAPVAVRNIKANLAASSSLTFEEALDAEARRHVACGRTDDATEAARAFVEKRRPVFTGQ